MVLDGLEMILTFFYSAHIVRNNVCIQQKKKNGRGHSACASQLWLSSFLDVSSFIKKSSFESFIFLIVVFLLSSINNPYKVFIKLSKEVFTN